MKNIFKKADCSTPDRCVREYKRNVGEDSRGCILYTLEFCKYVIYYIISSNIYWEIVTLYFIRFMNNFYNNQHKRVMKVHFFISTLKKIKKSNYGMYIKISSSTYIHNIIYTHRNF